MKRQSLINPRNKRYGNYRQIPLSLNRFSLSFNRKSKHLEKEFIKYYSSAALKQQRYILILGLLVLGPLGILDRLFFPADIKELYILRYGIISTVFIFIFILSFFSSIKRYMQSLMSVIFMVSGIGVAWMVSITHESVKFSYYPSFIMVIVLGYVTTKLRFIWASLAGWVIAVSFQFISIFVMKTDVLTFIKYNAMIIISNIIGMAACYFMEYYNRKDFYMTKLLKSKQREINKAYLKLAEKNQILERLSVVDDLTSLANRRKFEEHYKMEWRRLKREKKPLSLILCDVDFFKMYNDYYGHQAGDICLRSIGKAIVKSIKRPADLAARYGGEEFAVVLPDTNKDGAFVIAERILKNVRMLRIMHARSYTNKYVTLSIGVSTVIPSAEFDPRTLLIEADKALYVAKENGRNRFIFNNISA